MQDNNEDKQAQDNGKYSPSDLSEANKIIEALQKRLDERDHTIGGLRQNTATLNDRLSALEAAQQKHLEASGNYQELAKKYSTELESLRPVAERASTLEAVIRESNEARAAKVPENMRGLIPQDYAPEKLQAWLNANEALLSKPPAPQFDAGAGANMPSAAPIKLDAQEQAMARAFGMSDEQYAAQKAKRGAPIQIVKK